MEMSRTEQERWSSTQEESIYTEVKTESANFYLESRVLDILETTIGNQSTFTRLRQSYDRWACMKEKASASRMLQSKPSLAYRNLRNIQFDYPASFSLFRILLVLILFDGRTVKTLYYSISDISVIEKHTFLGTSFTKTRL